MNNVLLQLGSNMGNNKVQLAYAQRLIKEKIGNIHSASSLYDTVPWGNVSQHNFLNQVIGIYTKLNTYKLIDTILAIEEQMGRVRNELYGPRIIDIDVLFFNDEIINQRKLTVPHPLINQRRFVLEPLVEMVPDFIHPQFNKTMLQLLAECTDTLNVQKI